MIYDPIQQLLGCSWGRRLSTPDDTAECAERAVQILVLHDDEREMEVRLCQRHFDRTLELSTAREEAS